MPAGARCCVLKLFQDWLVEELFFKGPLLNVLHSGQMARKGNDRDTVFLPPLGFPTLFTAPPPGTTVPTRGQRVPCAALGRAGEPETTDMPCLDVPEAGRLEPRRPPRPLRPQGRGSSPGSGGCWHSSAFLRMLLSAVTARPLPCVPSLASARRTLVAGFRAPR